MSALSLPSHPLKIRASSLGLVMTVPKIIDPAFKTKQVKAILAKQNRTEAERAFLEPLYYATMSAGARTFVENAVRQHLYNITLGGYGSQHTDKGNRVEDQSIELYNLVNATSYTKSEEKGRQNDYVMGACDIDTGDMIIDIKSSWSVATFPFTPEQAESLIKEGGYEWQVRAYMWLWDRPHAEVAFCLVNTPEDLIGQENPELHIVEHIDPYKRVTVLKYTRCSRKEQAMRLRIMACQKYFAELVESCMERWA